MVAGATPIAGLRQTAWAVEEEQGRRAEHKKTPKHARHRSHELLLWQKYFRDPSQWWDNRHRKVHPGYPDFKHKTSKQPLWLDGPYTPSWVPQELRRRASEMPLQALPAQPCDGVEQVIHDKASDPCTAFVALLRACAKNKDLQRGARAHEAIVKCGLLERCSDALVTMYAKCGALEKSQELLDTHSSRNVFTWTALISGYAQQQRGQDALNCFEQMQREDLCPDAVTFTCILKACGCIQAVEKGEQIHDEIRRRGLLGKDIVLGNALVDMYAKCGALLKARQVLRELPSRDIVSWNALITGYVQHGKGELALKCLEQMQDEGLSPNTVTFICILKACGIIGEIDKGEQIYDEIARQGLLQESIVLGTALVDMYAKCGALKKAQRVLEELPSRDVIAWNALITGYAQQGQGEQVLKCLEQMQHEGLTPNAGTYSCVLKACSSIGAGDKGEQIHDEIVRQGLLKDNIVLKTAVVDMYAKCGALEKAEQIFEETSFQDVIPWNALITGYAQRGQGEQALSCFERMRQQGIAPDAITFSGVLNACSHLGLVEEAHVHFMNMIRNYSVKPDMEHYACMVDLFGRAGHIDKAVEVIQQMPSCDNAAVWSTLLGACQKWGDLNVAKWAFDHAAQADKSNSMTYVLLANLCAAAGTQEDAIKIGAIRMENKASMQEVSALVTVKH